MFTWPIFLNKITPAGQESILVTVPSVIGYLISANNRLYATGFSSNNIYAIEFDGTLWVIAGISKGGNTDGAALQASFVSPNGIAASSDGKTLYISQKNFKIRKLVLE